MRDVYLRPAQLSQIVAAAQELATPARDRFLKHCGDLLRPIRTPGDADVERVIAVAKHLVAGAV
jgi:hypothetical protein